MSKILNAIQMLENINTILEKLKYEDISNFLIEFSKAIDDASNNIPYYKILGLKNMNKINDKLRKRE